MLSMTSFLIVTTKQNHFVNHTINSSYTIFSLLMASNSRKTTDLMVDGSFHGVWISCLVWNIVFYKVDKQNWFETWDSNMFTAALRLDCYNVSLLHRGNASLLRISLLKKRSWNFLYLPPPNGISSLIFVALFSLFFSTLHSSLLILHIEKYTLYQTDIHTALLSHTLLTRWKQEIRKMKH
jgi:hypothetical protein